MAASEFWLSTNNATQTCEKSSPKELAKSPIVVLLCLFIHISCKSTAKSILFDLPEADPRKLCRILGNYALDRHLVKGWLIENTFQGTSESLALTVRSLVILICLQRELTNGPNH